MRLAHIALFASCTRKALAARGVRVAFVAALVAFALVMLFTGNVKGGALVAAALTVDDLNSLLEQIFNIADGAGESKGEMRDALDQISDLADPDTDVEQDASGTWVVSEPESEDEDAEDLSDDDPAEV